MEKLLQIIRLAEGETGSRPKFDNEEDAWNYLGVLVLYIKFDAECLTRENKALRGALKNDNDGK